MHCFPVYGGCYLACITLLARFLHPHNDNDLQKSITRFDSMDIGVYCPRFDRQLCTYDSYPITILFYNCNYARWTLPLTSEDALLL